MWQLKSSFRWIHDYQDACVDKLERFLRGEKKGILAHTSSQEDNYPHGPPHGSDPVVKPKKGHMFGLGSSFDECLWQIASLFKCCFRQFMFVKKYKKWLSLHIGWSKNSLFILKRDLTCITCYEDDIVMKMSFSLLIIEGINDTLLIMVVINNDTLKIMDGINDVILWGSKSINTA